VKQVLTFARGIEGERILLQPKHLLKEMVKIAQETFPKDIEVTAQYAPRLWVIKGDPTQLHQVLLNLCLNARDAMPDGGKLSLIAENIDLDSYYAQMTPDAKAGPYVVLTVTDTGHGIPDELLDKIFEPFFTTKAVGKGTGLGLATALGIVKSHGGFMHVYSVRGKGSQFKVHLPATRTDQADAAQIIPVAPPRGQGELVLVVDDEAPIRQITCRTLKENGYQVITANDGAEAVAVYAQNAAKIIVVLTDMIMPFMDGAATIRALHRINPEVRIIVASGMLTHKREAEAIGPGVRAFLSKPFTAEKLVSCLHEVLTRK
jgi:two-component system cell cycle sensor histidine kinase/response regulator CckA